MSKLKVLAGRGKLYKVINSSYVPRDVITYVNELGSVYTDYLRYVLLSAVEGRRTSESLGYICQKLHSFLAYLFPNYHSNLQVWFFRHHVIFCVNQKTQICLCLKSVFYLKSVIIKRRMLRRVTSDYSVQESWLARWNLMQRNFSECCLFACLIKSVKTLFYEI